MRKKATMVMIKAASNASRKVKRKLGTRLADDFRLPCYRAKISSNNNISNRSPM
jgi:hypothetical protein